MPDSPRTAWIVSHSHWDREWYMTYHQFRVNLTRIVKRVLDTLENDEDFEHFLLDGQAILLEDYLEVHPEDRERIARHVREGSLSIGPWYILPDEFLVSAESTVRNILIGHRVASAFGPVQGVGYMPDSFGHIAQMPQILRGAGLTSFVFTRGMGDEIDDVGHEFTWVGPDGSEVLALNQCEGYCNAGGLGFEEIWHAHTRRHVDTNRAVAQVGQLFGKLTRHSNGDEWLISNGCDHFPPQRDFGRVLAALHAAWPDTEFIHARLDDVMSGLRASGVAEKRYTGELRASRLNQVFPGVWSARMYLKQRNDRCQTLLERALEPVSAYSHFALGQPYPSGLIEYCWKTLLENHPHDSICGCSTDDVHRDMLPRFDAVEQTAEQELSRQLEEMAPTFARRAEGDRDTVIAVMNPLPRLRSAIVDRLVALQPLGYNPDKLRLLDADGNNVDFELIDRWTVERFWGVDYRVLPDAERQLDQFAIYRDRFGGRIIKPERDADVHDTYLHIQFRAENLPPMGHACFYLTERPATDSDAPAPRTVHVHGDTIENGRVRVRLNLNGTFDVEDLESGRVYMGQNLIEDGEDIGDEYDYSPCPKPLVVTSERCEGRLESVEDTGLRGRLRVTFDLELPAAIHSKRERRGDDVARCRVATTIGLEPDSRVVDIVTEFDNTAEDHRLRALFPTRIRTDRVVSDGHFMVNSRPLALPDDREWAQPAMPTVPQQGYSLVQDNERGVAIFNRGLPEIEAKEDRSGVTLCLTLLRSVGWLSRDDFPTRRHSNAGPTLFTPDAQCAGPRRFEYAFVPYAFDYVDAGIPMLSAAWRTPVPVVQGVEDGHSPGGDGLLESTSPAVCVSAVKKHEERDSLVVRLYNVTGVDTTDALELGRDVAGAWRTDLLERRGDAVAVDGARTIPVRLGPHEIVTLEIEFARD